MDFGFGTKRTSSWAFLTAVAAGSSIWCTHFIAMLAYEVTAPVTFDPILTMASLIVAITGCGVGFGLSAVDERRFVPEVCGAVVGISVALMHYTAWRPITCPAWSNGAATT